MKKTLTILPLVLFSLMCSCGSNTSVHPTSESTLTSESTIEPITSEDTKSSDSSSTSVEETKYAFNFGLFNSPSLLSERVTFSERISYEGHTILLSYENAYQKEGSHVLLGNGGIIKNNTKLSSFNKVKYQINGNAVLYYGHSKARINQTSLSGSGEIELNSFFDYFEIYSETAADIVSFEFDCDTDFDEQYQYIDIYDNEYSLIYSNEYLVGTVLDLSSLPSPNPIYYEDNVIPFLGYSIETSEEVVTSLTIEDKSVALYPIYASVQRFSWDYIKDTDTYVSNRKGARIVDSVESKQYGRFSCDFEVTNRSCTSVDLLFNLDYGTNSYPYEISDGTSYYAFHINPTNGGIQLSIEADTEDFEPKWNVLASAVVNSNEYWNDYWNKWNNNGNPTENLKFKMTAEFTPNSINCYLNDSFILSYSKEIGLNVLDSSHVGVRANNSGIIANNFEFVDYEKESSGFNLFSDGSYVAHTTSASTQLENVHGKYGKLEAEVTYCNFANNARTGLLLRAKKNEGVTNWLSNDGFYMHHNPTANANFTCTTIYNATYQKRPDGTAANIGTATYGNSTGYVGNISVLEDYYLLNSSFINKEIPCFSCVYAFELTENKLAIYLNDVEIYSCVDTSKIQMFDELNQDGVGFLTSAIGTTFRNVRWTSYEK